MPDLRRPGSVPGAGPDEQFGDRNATPLETPAVRPPSAAPPMGGPPRPKGNTSIGAPPQAPPPPPGAPRASAVGAPALGAERRSNPAAAAPRRPAGAEPAAPPARRFWPQQPRNLDETGLTTSMIEELVLKAIFFAGEMRGMDLANRLKLPSSVVDDITEGLRRQKYLDIRGGGASGVGKSTMIYQLTSFATDLLRQILDRNRYNGPAPVPLADWIQSVRQQSVRGNRITRAKMEDKFTKLVMRDYIFDGLGPAMNSGRAIFLYGAPGNGKTALCQAMVDCFDGEVFIPHAILIDDFIVRIYDDILHRPVEDTPGLAPYDRRYVRCRRPFVVVGGELTLEMLDLTYSTEVRYYEASFQMKATNGMLLIDDFGRQKVSPKDLLNRWIVPLENDVDNITLHTGKKVQVPFDLFAAFSTNLDPSDLVDDAFLRRVRYKMEVRRPDEEQFYDIFEATCQRKGVVYNAAMVDYLVDKHYRPFNRPFAACQPRDLLEQMIDMAIYLGIQPQLNPVLIDAAVRSYFVRFDKGQTP
ncbi:ATPase [Myxococcaceae bacterium GXIMD 01537]